MLHTGIFIYRNTRVVCVCVRTYFVYNNNNESHGEWGSTRAPGHTQIEIWTPWRHLLAMEHFVDRTK